MGWIAVALKEAQANISTYPSIHPSIHVSAHPSSQTSVSLTGMLLAVTALLTGQKRSWGLWRLEDATSACQADAEG